MFAIEINRQNLTQIDEADVPQSLPIDYIEERYLGRRRLWYFIRGYVTQRGALEPWTILPEGTLKRDFDYDPDKIKTEWSQIVRKEAP